MRIFKTILAKSALMGGAIVVVLIGLELALRLLGVSFPRTTQADSVLGVVHRPNIEFFYREEGAAWIRYNSAGFRDEEWPIAKPENEFRIAVLGDSFVEALQVPVDACFVERVESALKVNSALAGKTPNVMNLGVSGYGTGHELLLLRDRIADYKPDVVVVAILTGNDLRDNSRIPGTERAKAIFRPSGRRTRPGQRVSKLGDERAKTLDAVRLWHRRLVSHSSVGLPRS